MEFGAASLLFERYVDWERRLSREVPFLEAQLAREGARNVADVACGSGGHAAALTRSGFRVMGFDPDERLLHRAAARARRCKVRLDLKRASFAELPAGEAGRYDAVLCLGNSICLTAPGRELDGAFQGLSKLLKPGGVLVLHTLNYPALAARGRDPWGPVRSLPDGTLLLKGFLPRAKGPWDVLFITLRPGRAEGMWKIKEVRFTVYPHDTEALVRSAGAAGFAMESLYGGFEYQAPHDPKSADRVFLFRFRG